MAVREFDGTDDVITLSLGSCGSLGGGACSLVVIAKGAGNDGGPYYLGESGLNAPRLDMILFAGNWQLGTNFADYQTVMALNTGVWELIGATKASGTATPRGHRFNYNTTTWTHSNAGGTLGNTAAAAQTMNLGRAEGDSYNGRLAVVGVWGSALSDGDIETLETDLQAWVDLSPTGLWALNQASTGTAVEDLTGGGADQSAITGTTVITGDDPPGFDFTLGPGPAVPDLFVVRSNLQLR